ncbi:hypothetical protein V7S43_016910 [Phytophthora oleae]|uniref:Crinkler effector protein N-terminal domain-containing protein n=1 Tax=Phytophthora oleae TaxID=2107226 RepID=A0ABD3EV51_9STRA
MAKLFCAIVGVLESVLSVQIDENKSVGDLQKAIKSKDPITIQCKVDLLQLFLAKKNGMWLKETELKNGVSDTSGLKPLNLAGAPLNSVNLSEKDVQLQVTVDDFKVGKEPVHVLVMILKHNKLQFPVDVLLDAMLSYMALDMPTTETVPNIDFKDELFTRHCIAFVSPQQRIFGIYDDEDTGN